MRRLLILAGAALASVSADAAALEWHRSPDGHWEYIDPAVGQWTRAPGIPDRWRYGYPGWEWHRDPDGNWQLVPPQPHP